MIFDNHDDLQDHDDSSDHKNPNLSLYRKGSLMSKPIMIGTADPEAKTSKSKKELGIPDHHVICWIPFHQEMNDNALMKAYVKSKGDQPPMLFFANVLRTWFDSHRETIEKEAESFLRTSEKSAEELTRELQSMQRKMERMQAALLAKAAPVEEKK